METWDVWTERKLSLRVPPEASVEPSLLKLASEGADVALNYQSNDAKAQQVAEEVEKLGVKAVLAKANLADAPAAREMVKNAAEQLGGLDILVNNAGITRDRSLRKMSDEQWQEVIATNLNGYFYCTSAAIPFNARQELRSHHQCQFDEWSNWCLWSSQLQARARVGLLPSPRLLRLSSPNPMLPSIR